MGLYVIGFDFQRFRYWAMASSRALARAGRRRGYSGRGRCATYKSKVWVHRVSLLRQCDVCRHAHPIKTAIASAEVTPHSQARPGHDPSSRFASHARAIDQTDLGQIRVPVGHRLSAHLHQTDHRHEHPQVPEPADRQPGTAPPTGPGPRSDARQEQQGARGFPMGRPFSGWGSDGTNATG